MRLTVAMFAVCMAVVSGATSPCAVAAPAIPALATVDRSSIVEVRAWYGYGRSGRRHRRRATERRDAPRESADSAVPLPRPNPRRVAATQSAPRMADKTDARKPAKPEPERKSDLASPVKPEAAMPAPPAAWTPPEVLAGRERCLAALSGIAVDIDVAPPTRSGQCGDAAPVLLKGLYRGRLEVTVRPPALVNCRMVQAVYEWINQTVQPVAREILGEDIVRIDSVAGYQCRNRAGTTRLSEHGLANAIDILGFVTRSGQRVSVLDDWGPTRRDAARTAAPAPKRNLPVPATVYASETNGLPLPLPNPVRAAKRMVVSAGPARAVQSGAIALAGSTERFLKEVHARSCDNFATVLGPEANEDHRNHFHLDLAQRKRGAHYCR